MITITKVVSKDLLSDFVAKVQNLLGLNLTTYEKMVDKGIEQIRKELEERGVVLKWFRYEITQLTNGAVAIILYGETK